MKDKRINKLLIDNKDIFWDVKSLGNLDNNAIEERFLRYWNWQNIIDLVNIFWKSKFKEIYLLLRDKKRPNLSDKTINFFNLYLDA